MEQPVTSAAAVVGHNEFFEEKHVKYIKQVASDTKSFGFIVSQHLRMSGIYWGLTALSVLGIDIIEVMDTATIVDWVMSCQDDTGGFGGSVDHDPHMLYTLSAIQILALSDQLHRVDAKKVAAYVSSLQQKDGSFSGDKWGEIDTRFSYCALATLSILGRLNSGDIDVPNAVKYVGSCRNFDGGFGAVPGAESHAGQIFCCVGALSIGNALHYIDEDLLGWWLSERQCDSGGLNGRPEKQADVCYSWWILSSLSILGRVSWICEEKLTEFIINCQDADEGGIGDRAGNMSDIFHTFFGISGLSLLGYFSKNQISSNSEETNQNSVEKSVSGGILDSNSTEKEKEKEIKNETSRYANYREIDPTYALPSCLVKKLGLFYQKLDKV